MEGSTGRLRVTKDTFTRWLLVPSPPPDEQKAIARILDAVDAAIGRTRTAIDKARSLKRGLIQKLLSFGIGGETRKDSPIGKIPANWECSQLDGLIMDGPTNGLYRPESDYGDDGTPIIRIDSFDDGEIHSLGNLHRVRLPESEIKRYRLTERDILINRVNSLSHIGKSAIVPTLAESTVFESNMMRLQLDVQRLLPHFFMLILCSDVARSHWRARARPAVNQASINQKDVRSLWVPRPRATSEQQLIVDIVTCADNYLENLRRVLLGHERVKRGLIQNLLTGKVRVSRAKPASSGEN